MGVFINHTIAFLTSPLSVALAVVASGVMLELCATRSQRLRRCGRWTALAGLVCLYVFSSGWMYGLLGGRLERMYPPVAVEKLPNADAIVVLGGGVGANEEILPFVELYVAADRPVHGARLFKAGKAPRVHVTFASDACLLSECGVPTAAISVDEGLGNTEQEIRSLAQRLKTTGRPRVLFVTSAWYMRRTMLMVEKYARELEVIPAPCDYECLVHERESFDWACLLPSAEALFKNAYMVKEYVGYWGYRLFRR